MKTYCYLILLLFVSLLFNCSTENEESSSKEIRRVFSANIDGLSTSFTEDFDENVISPNHPDRRLQVSLYNNSKLVIKAFNLKTEQSITLVVGDAFNNEEIKIGTYQIGNPNGLFPLVNIYYDNEDVLGDNNNHFFNKNYGCHLTGGQIVGAVVISELDKTNKRIKGSFNGDLFGWVFNSDNTEYVESNVTITNGEFDLPYDSVLDYEKNENIDKGIFEAKITHEDRYFAFSPTDGVVTGVGTRHFKVSLRMNDMGDPLELGMQVENENLGVLNLRVYNDDEITIGSTYDFITDLTKDFRTLTHYIYFNDFYYNTGHLSSPLPTEKNNFSIKLISLDKENKIIEGQFSVRNSIRGTSMEDGYFKVKYEAL